MICEFSKTRVGSIGAGSEILVGVGELQVDGVDEFEVACNFPRDHFELFCREVPPLLGADFFFFEQAVQKLIH